MTSDAGSRKRILVADDHAEMRSVLQRALSLEGFDVDVAATGARALELLNSTVFHLVLLDVHMPEMGGFAVLAHMRGTMSLSALPVIMVTGAVDSESVMQGKKLGITDYLVKPYRIADLLARVKHSLNPSPLLPPLD